jgi:hypothetical protein
MQSQNVFLIHLEPILNCLNELKILFYFLEVISGKKKKKCWFGKKLKRFFYLFFFFCSKKAQTSKLFL